MKLRQLYKSIFVLFVLFTAISVRAQMSATGGWYIASLNYRFNKQFAVYGEIQARSQKLTDDFFYHEIKAGVNYYLPKNNSVFFGFGNYETYTFPGDFKKPVTANEFRMWEQFVLNNNINRVKIEHRYRIEQRWINGDFFNRFRYRLNPIVPLNNKTVVAKTVFISAYDEVFFTNKAPYFIRNRIFGGVGYQFTQLFTLQLGFIRQFDYGLMNNGSAKNFILASFIFNIDRTNDKRDAHPASMD